MFLKYIIYGYIYIYGWYGNSLFQKVYCHHRDHQESPFDKASNVQRRTGKTLPERARALIDLAHPDDRESLEKQAKERFGKAFRWRPRSWKMGSIYWRDYIPVSHGKSTILMVFTREIWWLSWAMLVSGRVNFANVAANSVGFAIQNGIVWVSVIYNDPWVSGRSNGWMDFRVFFVCFSDGGNRLLCIIYIYIIYIYIVYI